MFKDEVRVKSKNELRYGTTRKPAHETLNEIMELLDDYDCDRVLTDREGDQLRIGFIFQGTPYKIAVPRVYVDGEYNDKIGIRVVYHYLKMLLSWTKEDIVDLDKALMSSRMVEMGGESVALGEAADELGDGEFEGVIKQEHQLPAAEEDDSDVIEADYEEVED